MELFKFCPTRKCGTPCGIACSTAKCHSTMVAINQSCTLYDYQTRWTSQPMKGNVPAGNLMLSAGILYSSANPTTVLRVLDHINILGMNVNTFLNHHRYYLQPTVATEWRITQVKITTDQKAKGQPLILWGDGRCDSPGHSVRDIHSNGSEQWPSCWSIDSAGKLPINIQVQWLSSCNIA